MLGEIDGAEIAAIWETIARPKITANTIDDLARLTGDIAEGRRNGYFVTRGENVPDVWAVAKAVRPALTTLRKEGRAWFHRLPDGVSIDPDGMSGGPIIVLKDEGEDLRYWVVAIQNGWHRASRICYGSPIMFVAMTIENQATPEPSTRPANRPKMSCAASGTCWM